MTVALPVTAPVCPVCGSAICRQITAAASARWQEDAARRRRAFADPDRFGSDETDPATVCQTTRRPIPSNPSGAQQGRRGRANQPGIRTPGGE